MDKADQLQQGWNEEHNCVVITITPKQVLAAFKKRHNKPRLDEAQAIEFLRQHGAKVAEAIIGNDWHAPIRLCYEENVQSTPSEIREELENPDPKMEPVSIQQN